MHGKLSTDFSDDDQSPLSQTITAKTQADLLEPKGTNKMSSVMAVNFVFALLIMFLYSDSMLAIRTDNLLYTINVILLITAATSLKKKRRKNYLHKINKNYSTRSV